MHLTPIQRLKIVNIFNKFNDASCSNKAHRVSELAKQMSTYISEQGVRNIIKKILSNCYSYKPHQTFYICLFSKIEQWTIRRMPRYWWDYSRT